MGEVLGASDRLRSPIPNSSRSTWVASWLFWALMGLERPVILRYGMASKGDFFENG